MAKWMELVFLRLTRSQPDIGAINKSSASNSSKRFRTRKYNAHAVNKSVELYAIGPNSPLPFCGRVVKCPEGIIYHLFTYCFSEPSYSSDLLSLRLVGAVGAIGTMWRADSLSGHSAWLGIIWGAHSHSGHSAWLGIIWGAHSLSRHSAWLVHLNPGYVERSTHYAMPLLGGHYSALWSVVGRNKDTASGNKCRDMQVIKRIHDPMIHHTVRPHSLIH